MQVRLTWCLQIQAEVLQVQADSHMELSLIQIFLFSLHRVEQLLAGPH
jgi:hypothetical protein